MSTGNFDIQYVSKLARIALTEEELRNMGSQLHGILGYVEKLQEVNVEGVEPTAHSMPLKNVFRPDEVGESMMNELALENAPSQINGLFRVPKIVE